MWRDEATLLDIDIAARFIVDFTQGLDRDRFEDDVKTRSAVLHQFLVMGEAVKRLSAEFRARHPHIPWKDVAGMRDRLIHGYDQIDFDVVWEAAKVEVPRFLTLLRPLLPEDDSSS